MNLSTRVISTKIVSIYPYTRGFAYAVMDNPINVIEMRLFDLKEYDISKMSRIVRGILRIHQPGIVVLENTNSKYCRKGVRSKQFIRKIAALAKKRSIKVMLYSREDVRKVFRRWKAKNKYEIAEVLSRNIDSLRSLQMEKPKYPGREPNIEAIFSSVSMGVAHYFLED